MLQPSMTIWTVPESHPVTNDQALFGGLAADAAGDLGSDYSHYFRDLAFDSNDHPTGNAPAIIAPSPLPRLDWPIKTL